MRLRYYAYAVGLWGTVVVITVALSYVFPFLRTSLLSLILAPFTGTQYDDAPGSILGGWPIYLFGITAVIVLSKRERIYRYARLEEEEYRGGAEYWSFGRRVYMCTRFGLIHFWNVVISFALVIGLAVAGVYLMVVYLHRYRQSGSREMALQAATHAHVAYNRIALTFFGVFFSLLLVATVAARV